MGEPPPQTSGAVEVELHDGALWVTLSRPEAANARNQAMRRDLKATWTWCATTDDVRVVVLTAAGERHFCAGMDLKEAGQPEAPHERRERMLAGRDVELLAGLPQPTIAAVNGAALGGGFEMALACDLRLLSSSARVGLPEVTHGLMPGGGGTYRLPRLVGPARALELMLTGAILTAEDAVAEGLASRVVAPEGLREAVGDLARTIAEKDPAAVRAIKEAVRFGLEHDDRTAADRELDGLLWLLARRSATDSA